MYERPHEELVKTFRALIKEDQQKSPVPTSPEKLISIELFGQTKAFSGNKQKEISKEKDQFFSRLKLAWDSLVYDRIKAERSGEGSIDMYWGHTDDGKTVKLTHPLQVRLLEALTEAVGIPHERGQTVIEIPKNLKGDKKQFLEL